MKERFNFNLELLNKTKDEIAASLRANLAKFDQNPLRTWRWWSGFIWGCIFLAALKIGDVHICVGECDGKGLNLIDWSAP